MYDPNDSGYIHNRIVRCAIELKAAQEIYSQGHYSHSNAKVIPMADPLRTTMAYLSELDRIYCKYANWERDPVLFYTYEPPYEDTVRWGSGPMGVKGE